MSTKPTVAVGLSGGVDSATCAYLLKKQGYKIIGFFMKNWEDDSEHCPAEQDYLDALAVAQKIGIDLYTFNFSKEYFDQVFKDLLDGLKKGVTPNPDILCNREIKFSVFMKKALSLGATHLATGHYAQISEDYSLIRGIDSNKDQSYFLYTLKENILKQTLFPLGGYTKPQIRQIAKEANLPVFNKKDSTGICFIGKRNFSDFISEYMPPTKGLFKSTDGKVLGKHNGAWFYTIGQRKGLGIGGPGDAWYVVDKDIKTHTVYVCQGENHPSLFKKIILANEESWVGSPPLLPLKCTAKIRYRSIDVPCTVKREGKELLIEFEKPQRAITPAQSIVFYDKQVCLGGAFIS
ncbi:MAG: tRNA-specific 2-thiouridylase MnmA [Chlamydiia bacterium]|nr:tRNA-specific 2-thiouridylase MnmA [Chlamydiia bacterium]